MRHAWTLKAAWPGPAAASSVPPAFPGPVVDTTGAGDVFRAGFIAGWLAGGDRAELETVLRWANAVAALKCRGLGARSASPTRAAVEALLAQAM